MMSREFRMGVTFYFVRALYCHFTGADASARAWLDKALAMFARGDAP
jgi:hypothetical protein